MSTAPLQSRDALVTKTTRDGTQVLLDFLAETEPPSTSSTSTIQAGERTIIQRGPSLGGLALEKAKVRLGLLSKSRKKKVEEEGPRKRQSEAWVVVKVEEEGSLRINTPPPGTVAITRNSGHTVYMIGPPTVPPPPVPVPEPELSPTVLPSQQPESRARDTSAIVPINGSLDIRDLYGPGESQYTLSTSVSHNHGSPEHVQPPSYNEATERISIFIDAHALQAIQESRGNLLVRDQHHFPSTPSCAHHQHSRSLSFTPLVQTIRRPLPPLPRTRLENVEAGYAQHHRGGHTLPVHQITPDQMAVTPSQITGRSEGRVSKEGRSRSCDKCECTLEHPQFRTSSFGSHSGNGDPSLPKDGNSNLAALTNTKIIPVHGRSEATTCAQAPAVPNHRIGVRLPPHSSGTAEESLHIDELHVAEGKSLSKIEKALLRQVEFGSKVDNSILQLC